jgi:hypothetical protein
MWTKPGRVGLLGLAAALGLALAAGPALASAAADLPAPTGTSPVSGTGTANPGAPGTPKLVNVRTGRHDAYDRTVFDFVGGTPDFRVAYGTLVGGGTGEPIPVSGAATLVVTFTPAFAHDVDTGAPTYDITRVLNPNLPTLRQIRFGEDFEAHVSAGLGVNDRVGFRVLQLHNPDRIAIDVAHQPTQPFGTATVRVGSTASDTVVNGMRTGAHPGYDRLVFDLGTPGVPLVTVGYQGSGSTIAVDFSGRNVPAVVAGPSSVHIGLTRLRDASVTNAGNGTARVTVTTASRHGFRVMLLYQPTRVVLDVAQ